MRRLDPEARMTIEALSARGATRSEVARLLGVTEGAVRYHLRRTASGTADGRSRQKPAAEAFAEAIGHWRSLQGGEGVNLAALHDWLRREHAYGGSLRSVQRHWKRAYPAPAIRARRRVETPRFPAALATRPASPAWAAPRRRCGWTTRRPRCRAAAGRGGRSTPPT